MPAALAPPVSWAEFERLLDESGESPSRLSYGDGVLETVALSAAHELPNRALALFVEIAAVEAGMNVLSQGSLTIKREDLRKGVEPDSCYYIQNAQSVWNVRDFDFEVHPPPDLVIEVDITNDSRIKFPVFSALRIPEVWRYDGETVAIHVLKGDAYERSTSLAFPGLDGPTLTRFLNDRYMLSNQEWWARVREWARRR